MSCPHLAVGPLVGLETAILRVPKGVGPLERAVVLLEAEPTPDRAARGFQQGRDATCHSSPHPFPAIYEEVSVKADSFEAQNLAITAFALAQRHGFKGRRPLSTRLSWPLPWPLLAAACHAELDGQGMANLAQAMAKSRQVNEPWDVRRCLTMSIHKIC